MNHAWAFSSHEAFWGSLIVCIVHFTRGCIRLLVVSLLGFSESVNLLTIELLAFMHPLQSRCF